MTVIRKTVKVEHLPLSPRARTMRRLRDLSALVEFFPSPDANVSVSDFSLSADIPGFTREYHCTRCGAHVLISGIQTEGHVTCSCGAMEGKPL